MASKTFELSSYEITLLGQKLLTYENQAIPVNAIISCKGKNGETFDILVTNQWESLPPYSKITDTQVIGKIIVSPARYTWFVDLIRNEGPIYATVDNSSPMNNRLFTAGL